MKYLFLNKKLKLILLFSSALILFSACGNYKNTTTTKNTIEHSPEIIFLYYSIDQALSGKRNIQFINNTIETFDNRIVWADRVDGLLIKDNTIKQTTTEKPQFPDAHMFDLINCNNVEISNNTYNGNCEKTLKSDEKSSKTLKVNNNKGFNNL